MVRPVTAGFRRALVVAGPTASGKSDLAMALARRLHGEIVCCDSVQLYRGFDIGSAKPTPTEQAEIPHHMVDIISWRDSYDACRYALDARQAIDTIAARGKLPVIVGGTGLYLRALWREAWDDLPSDPDLRVQLSTCSNEELHCRLAELQPTRAAQIHRNDRYRLQRGLEIALLRASAVGGSGGAPDRPPSGRNTSRGDYVVLLTRPERGALVERIALRAGRMLEQGLIAEVIGLTREGCPLTAKPMQSIGYKQVAAMLAGELAADALVAAIAAATRQYAKRQRTWFQKVPADFSLTEPALTDELCAAVRKALEA